MKATIKNALYRALIENHWVNVTYLNKQGQVKNWYLGIVSFKLKSGLLIGEVFNAYKSTDCLDRTVPITLENIQDAIVMDETYFPTDQSIIDDLNDTTSALYKYFEVETMDNNILKYLCDCYKHDNDPFLRDKALVDGVIPSEFGEDNIYKLDDDQFKQILDKVFKKYKNDNQKMIQDTQQMGINLLSINIMDKQFVVAYKPVTLNFKNKTLKMGRDISFNRTFLLNEDSKVSLSNYIDLSPEEFMEQFRTNRRELIDTMKETMLYGGGELINTDTSIFLQARRNYNDLERACNSIKEMEEAGHLTQPLKAFFGRIRPHTGSSKNPYIVISDQKKINIDQMRVVYNSMVNHVTYVKGPPGTGKTETIFNVILSAIANKKTILICSNNNHPLNDIYDKLTTSFTWHNPKTNLDENLIFPALRIFNNAETPKTLEALRKILAYAQEHKNDLINEELTDKSKERSLSKNDKLKELLKEYEERLERIEDLERLKKIRSLTSTDKIRASVDEQIKLKQEKINSSRFITDEEVASLATSAKDDNAFRNYLHYYFTWSFKRLLNPTYKPLRDIIKKSENELADAIKEFNDYLRKDETLKHLLDVFPVIVCTNNSSDKLGTPVPHFDLVIMDEAGQCNLASSLIPITRGDDLLLVGDTNQLQPVTVIDEIMNKKFRDEYGIKNEYDYVDNSILSTMLSKDNNSKSLLLRYHYRCASKIASFPNARYYNDQLKLLNQKEGSLVYADVHNSPNNIARNSYLNEAKEVVRLVKENDYKDVGIITPFVNEANLINHLLEKEGIRNIRAGTVHTLQGSEKSTIILSSALSIRTSKKTLSWLEDNAELINVAVTRAKERLVFVGDKGAIDALSKGRNTDLKALSDYVANNGTVLPSKSEKTLITDFSNDSASEQMFFDTVKPYFNKRGTKFRIERNVQVKDAIKDVTYSEERVFGHKEFDIVISTSGGFLNRRYVPIVVFEIDGGEHIGNKQTAFRDRQKEDICKLHGIKLIRIANNDVKDYELIIQLFERTIGDVKEVQEMMQGSIFDDEASM